MDTKEAIEFIKHDLDLCLNDGIDKNNLFKAIDDIEDKLKRSEKFEEMWKELKDCNGFWHLVDKGKMYSCLVTLLEELEQKYLGKKG